MKALSEERVRDAYRSLMPEEIPDIVVFPEIDSTNSEGKRRIYGGLDRPLLLLAERQTAGRGRMGRTFDSPPGAGLYMTLCCPAGTLDGETVRVTAKAAVAAVRAIRSLTDLDLRIKWVNDLYVNGRKCCGILSETVQRAPGDAWLVVGIGINVTDRAFPDEIRDTAGSLQAPDLDRNALAAAVSRELLREIRNLHDTSYLALYRERSCVLGRAVVYGSPEAVAAYDAGRIPLSRNEQPGDGGPHCGYAEAIDDTGALIVRTSGGARVRLSTGDITIRVRGPLSAGRREDESDYSEGL